MFHKFFSWSVLPSSLESHYCGMSASCLTLFIYMLRTAEPWARAPIKGNVNTEASTTITYSSSPSSTGKGNAKNPEGSLFIRKYDDVVQN